ncbi:hypothetical protein D5086_025153, partial [Populus alba]
KTKQQFPRENFSTYFSGSPLKSLAQCKCVCREWNSINDSSFFVKKHTENVNKNLTLELQTGYTTYDLLGMAALLELCPNLETMHLDPLYKVVEDVSIPTQLLQFQQAICSIQTMFCNLLYYLTKGLQGLKLTKNLHCMLKEALSAEVPIFISSSGA